ncbi:hypothetical protein [Pseudonocardia sp. NPDC049635]|uniref:hypothetical protein n=1 Tax=Pseudonocardia sp. NPDC049635 TaxID=3155506 RepID=UPI0033E343D0
MSTFVKTTAAAAGGAVLALAGFWWLLSTGQEGAERFLAEFNGDDQPTPPAGAAALAAKLPSTHGLQLLQGEDLDDAVAHLVACGTTRALTTAEPGGWAATTSRLDEIAESVVDARINAALKWMDDHKLELVRRHG